MENYEPKSYSNSIAKSNLLKSPGYDDFKIFEMKEIQEEESYINNIKRQREKMEKFKYELEKKERYYSEIEQENRRLKPYYEKFNQMKEIIEETMEKMEKKEKENQKYKVLLEENAKEFKRLNARVSENENNVVLWKNECEKLQKLNKEAEESFYSYKQQCTEKEKYLTDQLNSFKSAEKRNRDEIMQLTQENLKKIDLVSSNNGLKEQNLQLEKENIKTLELLKSAKQKLKELETLNEKLANESESLKREWTEKNMNVVSDYKDLERDLERQTTVLQKQERIINELKNSKIEDEKRINQLKDENLLKEKELNRAKTLNSQLSDEYDKVVKRVQELEGELSDYRKENHELKRKIASLLEKEETDRLYRQELEKVKLDIISARNSEVERFNEALETMFPYSQMYDRKMEERNNSFSKKYNSEERGSAKNQYILTDKSD